MPVHLSRTPTAIKQWLQNNMLPGAPYNIEVVDSEVGPLGSDNNMAYDRGYSQYLNALSGVWSDGK